MRNDRLILGLAVTAFLGLYTALVFGFFTADSEARQLYLFLIGLPMTAILIFMPRAALIALALVIYSVRWLYDTLQILPREATWLGDVFILILIIRTVFLIPKRAERLVAIERFILLLLAFAAVSALLNGTNKITLLAGLRMSFRYVLLFVAAIHMNLSGRWVKSYLYFLFALAVIQPLIIWLQYSELNWRHPDALTGSFGHGGTPSLAIFLLTLIAYLVSRMIETGRVRIGYLFFIGWVSIAPFMGEAKMYFMFMPVLLLFMMRAELFRRPLMAIMLFSIAAVVMITADYFVLRSGHWYEGKNPLTFITQIPRAIQRDIEVAEVGRFERGYKFVNGIRLGTESWKIFWLGNGPGSITESFLSERHSDRMTYYSRWGISSTNTVSFIWLLIEYGYFGVSLFLVLLWMIFRRGRVLRASPDPEIRIWGRLLEATTFMYVAWMFYHSAWQTDQMGFIYWPLAGMLVRLSYQPQTAPATEPAPTAEPARLARPGVAAQAS